MAGVPSKTSTLCRDAHTAAGTTRTSFSYAHWQALPQAFPTAKARDVHHYGADLALLLPALPDVIAALPRVAALPPKNHPLISAGLQYAVDMVDLPGAARYLPTLVPTT